MASRLTIRSSLLTGRLILRSIAKSTGNMSASYIGKRTNCSLIGNKETVIKTSGNYSLFLGPSKGLVDERELEIRLSGAKPYELVTIGCTVEESGRRFGSHGFFLADQEGVVDVSKHPSVGGSYLNIDAHGLIWAMEALPGQRSGLRLVKRDVSKAIQYNISAHIGEHVDTSISKGKPQISASFERYYMDIGVVRTQVRGSRIRGTFFRPIGEGPFPCTIDMFGGAGGLMEHRSALLASRGVATLSLAIFNYDGLPELPESLDMEYFEEAMDYLAKSRDCDTRKGMGIIGVSKGAEISLLMAEFYPQISAVVSINGYHHNGLFKVKKGGKILKDIYFTFEEWENYLGSMKEDDILAMADIVPVHLGPDYNSSLIQPEKSENAKFLVLSSGFDRCCVPQISIDIAGKLKVAGKPCEVIVYPGAGHLLEPPYAPLCRYCYASVSQCVQDYGGEKYHHALAQRQSWDKMVDFLKTTLSCANSRL